MKENFKILIIILATILVFLIFVSEKIRFSFERFLASPEISLSTEIIGEDGFGNSLALSFQKNPAVSFLNEKEGLIFTEKINGRWRKEIVDPEGLAGNMTSLAFDEKGRPSILYIGKDFSLKLATKINKNWKIEKISDGAALSCNLVFNGQGQPNISFWNKNKGALIFGKREEGKWKIETVDSGQVGWWNDLAIDQNQNPHISYFDFKNKDLLYVFFDGKGWQKEIVDFEGDVGRWNSIVLDKKGLPYISYFDEQNADLKCAKKEKTGWEIRRIDTLGAVGERTNIVLDKNGNPVISYFDLSNSDFKLVRKGDRGWKIQLIDSKGEVGGDNSILIDKKGNILLLWQDLLKRKLKFLSWKDQF